MKNQITFDELSVKLKDLYLDIMKSQSSDLLLIPQIDEFNNFKKLALCLNKIDKSTNKYITNFKKFWMSDEFISKCILIFEDVINNKNLQGSLNREKINALLKKNNESKKKYVQRVFSNFNDDVEWEDYMVLQLCFLDIKETHH